LFGGDVAPQAAPREERSFCDAYKSLGKLYSDPGHPWFQELKLFSRLQYQYAHVDGSAGAGGDFNYQTDEFRRMYIGGSARLFQHLTISGQANYFDDDKARGGDSRDVEFQHMWDLYAKFDAGRALGLQAFDALRFGYGAREVNMSAEWNQSSKVIKTVERSAISNKIWPHDREFSNPTGFWMEGANGPLAWTAGVFTTTQEDWIANWTDGQLYYLKFLYDLANHIGADLSQVLWTMFYQDVEPGDDALAGGVEWTTSLSMRYGRGPWELLVEGIYGKNGDTTSSGNVTTGNRQGDFWGIVILPSFWIVKDRLEAVARYQYQGAEEPQGIRIYSRYARRADVDSNLLLPNGGRADEHHSAYAGLNYYFCGNNAKVMAGLQYDSAESNGTEVFEGWTTFLAFRTFF